MLPLRASTTQYYHAILAARVTLLVALVWVMTNNTQHRNIPGTVGRGWGAVAGGGGGMVGRGWGVVAGMGPVVDWAKLDCWARSSALTWSHMTSRNPVMEPASNGLCVAGRGPLRPLS